MPSDGFWQYGVAGAGVLSPSIGTSTWATNLSGFNKLQAVGSFTTPAIHIYSVVGGSNTISMSQTSLINVNSQTNANATIYLTQGDGDIGQHVWMFNSFTNTGFCLNSGDTIDNAAVHVFIRGNSWCPTQVGESLELYAQSSGWVEIGRSIRMEIRLPFSRSIRLTVICLTDPTQRRSVIRLGLGWLQTFSGSTPQTGHLAKGFADACHRTQRFCFQRLPLGRCRGHWIWNDGIGELATSKCGCWQQRPQKFFRVPTT